MFRNILSMNGITYNLDIRDKAVLSGGAIWIVRITDNNGEQITSARMCGEQDNVAEKASEWVNALCRLNKGQFFKYTIEQHIEY